MTERKSEAPSRGTACGRAAHSDALPPFAQPISDTRFFAIQSWPSNHRRAAWASATRSRALRTLRSLIRHCGDSPRVVKLAGTIDQAAASVQGNDTRKWPRPLRFEQYAVEGRAGISEFDGFVRTGGFAGDHDSQRYQDRSKTHHANSKREIPYSTKPDPASSPRQSQFNG